LDYYDETPPSPEDRVLLNTWIDAIIVASFSRIARGILRWFSGFVILRAFGGYPYAGVLRPATYVGHRDLNAIAHSAQYYWCPILPYLSATVDPRLTRNEIVVPAFVTAARLPYRWFGTSSKPYICDVISLIARYRQQFYEAYTRSFGELPMRIFGNNDRTGALANDDRIVGPLDDDHYFRGIATSRLMVYFGSDTKFHLHYHPLEALTMGVPVVFSGAGSIAHHARYYGTSDRELGEMGMCDSREDALLLARECLADTRRAVSLSVAQEPLREQFRPARAELAVTDLVHRLTLKRNYARRVGEPMAPELAELQGRIPRLLGRLYRGVTA
jgi:hypothetical protein